MDEAFSNRLYYLGIKNELYYRYADDIDVFPRSIVRRTKFCPEEGAMVQKSEAEIEADSDKQEDKITMIELRKIADTIQDNIKTESESPSNHPELRMKVPVLDLAI